MFITQPVKAVGLGIAWSKGQCPAAPIVVQNIQGRCKAYKKWNWRRRLAKTKISAQAKTSPKKQNFRKSFERSFRPKLSKQELRRQRLIKKRLNKRQSIRRRYRQLILKGLFIKKAGDKIIQTLSLKSKKFEKTRTNKRKSQRTSLNFKGNMSNVGGQSRQTWYNRVL